jgi:hypothetical protein
MAGAEIFLRNFFDNICFLFLHRVCLLYRSTRYVKSINKKCQSTMKKINKISFMLLALVALGFGCSPEAVGPTHKADEAFGAPGAPEVSGAFGDPQPALNPVCGPAKTYELVSEDGSALINRCFGPLNQGYPAVTCPGGQAPWGTATIMNGLTEVIANFDLAEGWRPLTQMDRAADLGTFEFNSNGIPVVGSGWTMRVINPVVGRWQVARSLQQTGDQFGWATRIIVVKLDAMGLPIPTSATTLWLRDAQAAPGAPSAYIANWTRNICPPVQNSCTVIQVGNPALPSCTTLAPTVANPVGAVTYAWSTGATTATLAVCPTANATYSVTASDNSGPLGIFNYTVKVVSVACGGNNGNVRICHIPPGNPNNQQEICVSWNNAGGHLPAYRPAGASGHDTGCQLGRCNSNPCN